MAEVTKLQKCPLTTPQLVDIVWQFIQIYNEPHGIQLYTYQRLFMRRVIESLLDLVEGQTVDIVGDEGDITFEPGATVTALWARQCLAKGTPILMFDGTQRRVEYVRVGDLVMGDDSTPRRVLTLGRGRQKMIMVKPVSNCHESYTVNQSHILSVKKCVGGSSFDRPRKKHWEVFDIEAAELIGRSLDHYRGYKVPVEFEEQDVPLEPYFLGAWLGDGTSRSTAITSIDNEVISYIQGYALRLGLRVAVYPNSVSSASSYAIVSSHDGTREGRNPVRTALQGLELLCNKHIPQMYKSNSRRVRLELLAGIIDTDGHRSICHGKENTCEVTLVNKVLADDLQWLCRSLGLRASQSEKVVNNTVYYRTMIYGDLTVVPTKILRKQWHEAVLKDDPTKYGFTLEELPEDDFYGFTVDGNHRFLLGDCTVTHNSGKSESIASLAAPLCILLPALAKAWPDDQRLISYKNGIWVGIFAPRLQQSWPIYERIRGRAEHDASREIYSDSSLNVYVSVSRGDQVSWSNGSFVTAQTASEHTNTEGKTFHLIIIDEAQYVAQSKVSKEIQPMLSATNGVMVKIGTAHVNYGGFRDSILMNIENEKTGKKRNHFEFPYDIVIEEKRKKYRETLESGKPNTRHLKYEASVRGEIERLGGNVDNVEFCMNYRLLWQSLSIGAVDMQSFLAAADITVEAGRPRFHTRQVAGLDFGKTRDRTVLTIAELGGEVEALNALIRSGEEMPVFQQKTFVAWHEPVGLWRNQLKALVDFLASYAVDTLCADATGVGDPLVEHLSVLLPGVNVVPIKFSGSGNDALYKYYLQELESGRIRYAAGEETQRTPEYQKFIRQHQVLSKEYKGALIVCRAPEGEHDDYTDSAALCTWATTIPQQSSVECGVNPFYGSTTSFDRPTSRAERYRHAR